METFALKIDVDTEVGTRIGVPNLMQLLLELNIPATFFFSLGPDNTGRNIKKIFRKGYFKKVARSNVVGNYGIKTLLSGVLFPGPKIGKKHSELMRTVKEQGFEVAIHCYDHFKWQDGVMRMTEEQIKTELRKAIDQFYKIFGTASKAAASPGWQANAKTLTAYDEANFAYGSDCRGKTPFFPKVGDTVFRTLQIPTTLPTLDELLGRPEFPLNKLTAHYLSLLHPTNPNILTLHAELEGMKYLHWFRELLLALQPKVQFKTMEQIATEYMLNLGEVPTSELIQAEVDGRSGLLAMQKLQ
jgi:undecaprenyl phosphate-alpha-L-ara4FN deformylase